MKTDLLFIVKTSRDQLQVVYPVISNQNRFLTFAGSKETTDKHSRVPFCELNLRVIIIR